MLNTEMTASADALVLQCNDSGNFIKHPPGIYQGVCIDVIDLGVAMDGVPGQAQARPQTDARL